MKKKVIIIGAGPAGLTAAYELLQKKDIQPIIFESTDSIGGISKTIDFNGNKIDIGGHRFFSKSENIMRWWINFLNLQQKPAYDDLILGRCFDTHFLEGLIQMENFDGCSGSKYDPECANDLMLIRNRVSRIIFNRKFFDYPVSLTKTTLSNLGILKVSKIILSYLSSQLNPKNEISLEDFFINRFGKELYNTFFKDYTEKVWGVSCCDIKPEWGAQRVKGLSITKTITHALKNSIKKGKIFNQNKVETSLIEQFLYPKFGPGQMWETVAKQVVKKGGEIHLNMEVCGFDGYELSDLKSSENVNLKSINSVNVKNKLSNEIRSISGDYFLSTMPVKDLIQALHVENGELVPKNVLDVSKNLIYRDFVTVGLLLKKLKIKNQTIKSTLNDLIPDNWIYVQERDVKLGRIQIFNNWSPYMVKDLNKVWIGLEYFCKENDEIWSKDDSEMIDFALNELNKIGFSEKKDFLEGVVIRMPKAYPAYFGSYDKFDEIRNFTDNIENLFLIGRNGMHRYNNMDHSMLTAMIAVDNICSGNKSKANIWEINSETEYHESKDNSG